MLSETRTEYRIGWKNRSGEECFSTATTDRAQADRALEACTGHPFRRDPWMQMRTVTVTETDWSDLDG